ncbi:MAG: DUF167 domain-containing protein [Nanoarchaeota archaeon]
MEIIVHPRKRKTEILEKRNGVLIINVKGKAENNEANNEIIRFFTKKSGKKVKIIRGLRSKRKTLKLW